MKRYAILVFCLVAGTGLLSSVQADFFGNGESQYGCFHNQEFYTIVMASSRSRARVKCDDEHRLIPPGAAYHPHTMVNMPPADNLYRVVSLVVQDGVLQRRLPFDASDNNQIVIDEPHCVIRGEGFYH